MQKIKALGFNTVSFYTLWGLHNPAEGSLDFNGWKNLQPFIDAAKESGLWMIARPGPYIVSQERKLRVQRVGQDVDVAGRAAKDTRLVLANDRTPRYREEVFLDGSPRSTALYGQLIRVSKTLTDHIGRLLARSLPPIKSAGEVRS
jgi:hypothetical protein